MRELERLLKDPQKGTVMSLMEHAFHRPRAIHVLA